MKAKTAHLRFIIHSEIKSKTINILEEIISNLSIVKDPLIGLKKYEDDFHYEFSFSINLTAKNYSDLEHKAFKLCTTISKGPWLFINLDSNENEFAFEAIFNHEAFIHHSSEYNNKLKWAHLEVL